MDGFAELQFFSFPFHYYFSSLREFQCLFGLCYFFQMARSESRKSLKLLRDYIADLDAVSSIIWHKYFSCSLIVRKAVRPKPIITVRSIWKLIEKKLYSRLSEFLLWLRTDWVFLLFPSLSCDYEVNVLRCQSSRHQSRLLACSACPHYHLSMLPLFSPLLVASRSERDQLKLVNLKPDRFFISVVVFHVNMLLRSCETRSRGLFPSSS